MYMDEVITLIETCPDCNFIAMAITPYQATGTIAAIKYLHDKGISLSGFILITSHPDTGRSIDEKCFVNIPESIKCIEFEYSFGKSIGFLKKCEVIMCQFQAVYDKEDKPLIYFVWTDIVNNLLYAIWKGSKSKKLSFIKIDDGAASYISTYKCRLSHLLYAAKSNVIKKGLAYAKAGMFSFLTNIFAIALKKSSRYTNANIFLRQKDGKKYKLKRNEMISGYYSQAFQDLDANIDDVKKIENAIVINSQGLGEFGISDGKTDFQAFEKVAELLADSKERIVLKPHPREKEINKYINLGWDVLKTRVSQEVLIAKTNIRPKCIISIYSSTLLNAYGLYNVPVISLAKILLRERLSNTLRNQLMRYVDMYEGIVLFPSNYDELLSIINKTVEGEPKSSVL